MMTPTKMAFLVAGAAMMTACVTGPQLAPAGMFATEGFEVPLQQDWTAIDIKTGKNKNAKLLTHDGVLLNSVYLFNNLKEGDSILRQRKKEEPVPKFSADLSDLEQVEFLTDSLAKGMGLVNLATTNVEPSTFKGEDAIAFDFTGVTEEGLNMSGTALVGIEDETLNVLMYLAPSLYYHGKHIDDVNAMIAHLAGVPAG